MEQSQVRSHPPFLPIGHARPPLLLKLQLGVPEYLFSNPASVPSPLGREVHRVPAFQEVPLCRLHHPNQVHLEGQGVQVCQADLGGLPSPFLQELPDLLSGPRWRAQVDLAGLEAPVAQGALGVLVVLGVPWHQAHPLHPAGHCCQEDLVFHSHP